MDTSREDNDKDKDNNNDTLSPTFVLNTTGSRGKSGHRIRGRLIISCKSTGPQKRARTESRKPKETISSSQPPLSIEPAPEQGANENPSTNTEEGQASDVEISKFKKIPILNDLFIKRKYNNGTFETECIACSGKWKSRETSRLVSHIEKCPYVDHEIKSKIRDLVPDVVESGHKSLEQLLVEMLVDNNISLKVVQSRSFKKFLTVAAPHYKLPPMEELGALYIQCLSKRKSLPPEIELIL